jgi:ferric-dicitrate binding protein FerR (iron transport regulator)
MNKKLFSDYKAEDFVTDESFINYHLDNNSADGLQWKEWILNHPEKAEVIAQAEKLLSLLCTSLSKEEIQNEYLKLLNAIEKNSSLTEQPKVKSFPVKRSHRQRTIRYVRLIGLLVFAAAIWLVYSATHKNGQVTTVNTSDSPESLMLSDGTIVTLQPQAELKYDKIFHSAERNVYLRGNANFKVKKDAAHPFKVHSENMVATVLGTVFDIKKSGDSALVIELLTGKLHVQFFNTNMEPEQSMILTPNERAVYVRSDKHLYKNLIIPMNFRQSNFDEIASQMKDAFDIVLINESPKKNWSFTGEFTNSSAMDIIENICLVKNLTYSQRGDTVLIK